MTAPRDHRDLLKAAVLKINELEARLADAGGARREPVAVVGIGCRFPGSVSTPGEFWELLASGRDAITEIPESRWAADAFFDPRPGTPGKMYTRRAGFVDGVDQFDPHFFAIAPREAAGMDPQQRLLLETAWEALERAGLPADRLSGSNTGVFVGICNSDYSTLQVGTGNPAAIDTYFGSGVAHSIASGRLSYALGLQGPSVSVDTACSSSALALHLACSSLRAGECDAALAGGVNVILTPLGMITASQGRMLSPDGKCKTFDASADGYARAEGAAVVVLKRLADATRDGDNVLGVILGSAVNQDGRSNGLTAPNPQAQEAVIKAALADAGVAAKDIGYVEAHGTGTALGDPIEMKALAAVFGRSHTKDQPLLVGSVKTNVGHLEAAAGLIGLVKILLSLQHEAIPPHLHLHTRSPYIPWDELPIDIPTATRAWARRGSRRIAGLSSFGFSGTNAHFVVAEAPPVPATSVASRAGICVFPLSAKTTPALTEACGRAADWLESQSDADIAAICASASRGRTHFADRVALLGRTVAEIRDNARAAALGGSAAGIIRGTTPDDQNQQIAFLFTGQGSQYHAMGRALFEHESEFRRVMEAANDLLKDSLQVPLLDVLYGDRPDHNALIHTTAYAQPALFALELGLAKVLESWGIKPGAVAGHSVGEYAAACVAGVMVFEDALRLIAERGRLMQAQPAGGVMAAIFADLPTVAAAIQPWAATVSIAACNGPRNIVVSGRGDHVTAIIRQLAERGIEARPLTVSHAFHSPLMDPVVADFRSIANRVTYVPPCLDLVSNISGEVATDNELCSGDYWTRHLRQPVQFERTIATLRGLGYRRFVELGPSPTLCSIGSRILHDPSVHWIPVLRPQSDDVEQLRRAFATLYASGIDVNWRGFVAGPASHVAAMPTYPFQRKRYWVTLPAPSRATSGKSVHPLLGEAVRSPRLKEKVFQAALAPDSPSYLADHRIFDRVIVPAAAYLEIAAAAATQAFGAGAHVVSDLAVQEAMLLGDDTPLNVQTVVTATGPGSATVEIFSEDPRSPDAWRVHASATISAAAAGDTPARPALDDPAGAPATLVNGERYYATLSDAGVAYGETFRAITEAERTDGAARATLTVPDAVAAAAHEHRLHPAIVDCCLQSLGLAFPPNEEGAVYLPMGVEQYVISAPPSARMVCRASLRGDATGETVIGDVMLARADDGGEVARIAGVRFKRAKADRVGGDDSRRLLYQVEWRPIAPPSTAATKSDVLLIARPDEFVQALADELKTAGVTANMSEPSQALPIDTASDGTHVVFVAGGGDPANDPADDAQAFSNQLLHVVQSIASSPKSLTLSIVTRRAQPAVAGDLTCPAHAALWGLGRVIAAEQPSLACRLIDAEAATPAAVASALLEDSDERQIAVREAGTFAPRLVRADSEERSPEQPYTLEIRTRGVLEGLELQPAAIVPPAAGEVQLRVFATGLNFRDVLNAMGMYPGDAGPLGSECVGEVTALGAGVTGVEIGERVMAITDRGFSTYANTKVGLFAPLPSGMAVEEAATVPIAFLTAAYALHNLGRIKRGERVLIHAAAGGVGLAAVQLAKLAGAEIFATAGSPEKRRFLHELGIDHVMDSRSLEFADQIRGLTGGEGVDLVLNSLTGESIGRSLGILRDGGRFLEIGKTDLWDAARVAAAAPGVSYHVLYLGDECARTPDVIAGMLRDLVTSFESGALRPLPTRVFAVDEVEQAFRYMAQARHIGKVVVSARRPAPAIRKDAAYLVTGGTGGLGLKTAEWLAAKGAGHIVLVSRRAPAPDVADVLGSLQRTGAKLTTVQADVSRPDEVDRVLALVDTDGLPLAGIFHAAGIVDDGVLAQQTTARFAAVMAPKVRAAWHLHAATERRPLDYFVLYSAGAALFGSPGQGAYAAGNAFLDGLAHFRVSRGLPATAINWGPWSGVGMAARLGRREHDRWTAQGLNLMTPDQGIRALEAATARHAPQIAALAIDWRKFLEAQRDGAATPLLREMATSAAVSLRRPQAPASIVSAIEAADPLDRLDLLRAHIREQIQRVLAVDAEDITNTQGLMELGMDSLMSVELSNRLKTSVGQSLPTTLAFEHPTVDALTAHLAELLGITTVRDDERRADPRQSDTLTQEVAALSEEEAALSLQAELEHAGY